jgi:hypothetical protein
LVTYREVDLLIDAVKASNQQKQRVAVVVAHELAHQASLRRLSHALGGIALEAKCQSAVTLTHHALLSPCIVVFSQWFGNLVTMQASLRRPNSRPNSAYNSEKLMVVYSRLVLFPSLAVVERFVAQRE